MSQATTPTGVRAPHGARVFEISWGDGAVSRLPHSVLRGYCPCAGCQGHSGTIKFHGGNDLELIGIEPVGNYALQLRWGDSHDAGLYTFGYLKRLGDLVLEHGEKLSEVFPELPRP